MGRGLVAILLEKACNLACGWGADPRRAGQHGGFAGLIYNARRDGPPRIVAREPGQVRKEAAITGFRKCRGFGSSPPFFRGRNTPAVAFAALAAAVCPLASSVPPGHPSGSWFPGASRPVPVPAPSSRWHLAPGKPRVSVLPFWRLSPPKTRCKHNPLIRYWPASGGRMISIRWSARTRSCARCATRSTISGCIMPTC